MNAARIDDLDLGLPREEGGHVEVGQGGLHCNIGKRNGRKMLAWPMPR
jgi:hypothetical protein